MTAQTVSFKDQPMHLFSWLTKRMTGRTQKRRAPACRAVPRFRPQLEVLEDRLALSTLTVTNALDSGRGSLRAEIAAAKSNDTIVFSSKLDGQTIRLTSGELDIAKNLTIQGPGDGQLTISGGGVSRVFKVNYNENVTLSGLTISDGNVGYAVNGPYGLVYSQGGGILNGGALTLSGDTLSGNSASYGGGIFNVGALTVNNGCLLSGNTAYVDGGGIYNNSHSAAVTDSTLSGNSAAVYGGGIYNGPGGATLTISGGTLSGNYVGADGGDYPIGGGGVYNAGRLTALNSIFSGNYDYPERFDNYSPPDNLRNIGGSFYTDGGGNIFS
jgi:hypothetical protein